MARTLRSGSSYLSQSELVLTFGLGSKTNVSRIEGPVAKRPDWQAVGL